MINLPEDRKTLILTYHDVVDTNDDLYLYDVSLKNFKEQTGCVKEFAKLNVILTFDDGYKSWAENILEVLKSLDLTAYFFVCIKNLEEGKLSKEDVLKLKNNGMNIGSHSVTHRFLHALSEAEIFNELNESKKILEDIIREEVKYFSIPRGLTTKTLVDTAKKVGYKNVFSSEIGVNHKADFLLKRVPIRRNVTLNDFKNILNRKNIKRMAFNQKLKDAAKKLLGINTYNYLRKILVRRAE